MCSSDLRPEGPAGVPCCLHHRPCTFIDHQIGPAPSRLDRSAGCFQVFHGHGHRHPGRARFVRESETRPAGAPLTMILARRKNCRHVGRAARTDRPTRGEGHRNGRPPPAHRSGDGRPASAARPRQRNPPARERARQADARGPRTVPRQILETVTRHLCEDDSSTINQSVCHRGSFTGRLSCTQQDRVVDSSALLSAGSSRRRRPTPSL